MQTKETDRYHYHLFCFVLYKEKPVLLKELLHNQFYQEIEYEDEEEEAL